MNNEIDVVIGNTLGLSPHGTPTDPSGLHEGLRLSEHDVATLIQIVKDLMADILSRMPMGLQDNVVEKISPLPLYAHTNPGRFEAIHHNIVYRSTGSSPRGLPQYAPECIPPVSVTGMLIGCNSEQIHTRNPRLLSTAYHELVHGSIWDAVCADLALSEAIALRMQGDHRPDPNFYATNTEWDRANFRADTGFHTNNLATFQRSRQSNTAWYITGAHALDDVNEDAIMHVCEGLMESSKNPRQSLRGVTECVVPMQDEIHEAFRAELGPKASSVLGSILMRSMEAGERTVTLPMTHGDTKQARFRIHHNTAFGELDASGMWNGVQYVVSDIPNG